MNYGLTERSPFQRTETLLSWLKQESTLAWTFSVNSNFGRGDAIAKMPKIRLLENGATSERGMEAGF
ncbi:MAG: hypothetical protein V7K47_05015 [Nostoc sp.]